MRNIKLMDSITLSLLFTFLVTPAFAATITVPGDAPTIQSGITAAVSGDTILVASGTYVENITFGGKLITLLSAAGAAATTIDGGLAGSVVTFSSGETDSAVIDGFTVRNGSAGTGGGIFCFSTSPTVRYCTITDNRATSGGGIYCEMAASPTVESCMITQNSAIDGGGIYIHFSSPTIMDCTISDNDAGYDGGGIYSFGSASTITRCRIPGNNAHNDGGGIFIWNSFPTITNCTITGNSAGVDGGGICYFSCFSPPIAFCTVSGNRAVELGGGVFCDMSTVTIIDSILWEDSAEAGAEIALKNSSTATVSYSDVEGGAAAVYVEPGSTLSWLSGNIDVDPLFVAAGYWDDSGTPADSSDDVWTEGDYHLTERSPCIDAGTDGDIYIDIDLDARPLAAGFDMGSDEYAVGGGRAPLIAFIRHRVNDNQYLNIYDPPAVVGGEINPLVASDTWIGNVGAGNEITHMTAGDIDGDGDEELIFIRHKISDAQFLNIYDEPLVVGGEINPLVASDTWIGKVGMSNEITHMAAGDIDEDGIDELIFIRRRTNGNQYLNIYDSPTVVGGDINPLLASDTWIGSFSTRNEITHMAAGNIDGDGTDEIVFIRHRGNDNQYLNIYDSPTVVGGDINPLVASDLWIGNTGTNSEITHMAAGDTDGDGDDEIVFIRHRLNENQYLNIYDLPTVVGGDINPLLASDTWIGNVGTDNEITHMTMIR